MTKRKQYVTPRSTRRMFHNGGAPRVNIPPHLVAAAGWSIGDTIAFQITTQGSILMSRVPVPDYVALQPKVG